MKHSSRLDAIEQALRDALAKAEPIPLDDETRARLIEELLARDASGDQELAWRQSRVRAILEKAKRRYEQAQGTA